MWTFEVNSVLPNWTATQDGVVVKMRVMRANEMAKGNVRVRDV